MMKEILKKYLSYINELEKSSLLNYNRFIHALSMYIKFKKTEQTFDSTYLPAYEAGQIVLIDFGCGVGHEFIYPHYAIVLITHDRKKSTLLTVVPLTSKKEKHAILRPHEYELKDSMYTLLGIKSLCSLNLKNPGNEELSNDIEKVERSEIDKSTITMKYSSLVFAELKVHYKKDISFEKLLEYMKKGTIVETNQVKTVSKVRIIEPQKRNHILYGIKVSEEDLAGIRTLVKNNIIESAVDS